MGINGLAPKLDTVDDDSSSGAREGMGELNADPADNSLLDDQTLHDILSDTDETTPSHEYVLKPSTLNERMSLEELAELATGSYKRDAPEADTTNTLDSYFPFTRKLKVLEQDQVDLEEIKSSPVVKRT